MVIHISTRWPPAHTSKQAQDWCPQNLPNFINKDDWLGNSPNFIPNGKPLQHSKRKSVL